MDIRHQQVTHTNDQSIHSKVSMSCSGYVQDNLMQCFVPTTRYKRSPLINRGYYLRFKAVEWAFHSLDGQFDVVVSLGCGFDTSSFRYPDTHFIEVDLPDVVRRKAQVLREKRLLDQNHFRTDTAQHLFVAAKSPRYCLMAADLRRSQDIVELIVGENLIQPHQSVVLFNECSLCYLKQKEADALIREFFKRFQLNQFIVINYEQVKSERNQSFASVMLSHFESIGSPLLKFLSRQEEVERFRTLKFQDVQVIDMFTFYHRILESSEKLRIDNLEPFDEYEEFDLLCSAYALTIAKRFVNKSSRVCSNEDVDQTIYSNLNKVDTELPHQVVPLSFNLFRFGQALCLINKQEVVVFGGFGCESNSKNRLTHKRLDSLVRLNPLTLETTEIKKSSCNLERRMHSQLVALSEDVLLLSGGRLAPNAILDQRLIHLLPSDTFTCSQPAQAAGPPNSYRHLTTKLNSSQVVEMSGKTDSHEKEAASSPYILDINTMTWQRTSHSLANDRHSFAGTSNGDSVLVVQGGLRCHDNSFCTGDVQLIDFRQEKVETLVIANLDQLYSHKLVSVEQNKLLAVGGVASYGSHNHIDTVDLRNLRVVHSFDLHSVTGNILLHNFSCHLLPGEKESVLCLFGGGGNCFSFGTHFNQSLIKCWV